jgi:hypothetical protein
VQNDVTLIHSENSSEKKRCKFRNKITLLDAEAHFLLFSPNRGLHNRPNEWSIFKKASPRKRIRCVGEDKRE